MTQPVIDFRSDTVTVPTDGMKAAMFAADVGDDVYGEDPTVNRLEHEVASLLGKDAAIFVPTGTMANQLAINLHCNPGDSIIAEENTHCYIYEGGAAAALSGVQFDFFPLHEGPSPEAVRRLIRPETLHSATTKLLVLENTHNRGAGRALDLATLAATTDEAKQLGLATHCDGARLWNAAVARAVSEQELASRFDSVAVCLSKGLGCPVGSLLVGGHALIVRARRLRKRWGGGMRQAGYLAAAGLYALEHHRHRLADDHDNAALLRDGLRDMQFGGHHFTLATPDPITNMVYLRWNHESGDELVQHLKASGILMSHLGQGWLRAVIHLQISRQDVLQALSVFQVVLPKLG